MNKISMLIVEDEKDWLEAITLFLKKEDDLEIAGCAYSREEAVEILKNKRVDIILLDINLNGNKLDGIDAISDFRKISDAEIIMVTSMDDREIVIDSFNAGAVHYVLKSEFLVLPHVIRSVVRGKAPMQVLSHEYISLRQESRLSILTASEREIFNLICSGASRKAIEIKQNKSINTIRNQINSILKKLQVKNCRELRKKYGTRK